MHVFFLSFCCMYFLMPLWAIGVARGVRCVFFSFPVFSSSNTAVGDRQRRSPTTNGARLC